VAKKAPKIRVAGGDGLRQQLAGPDAGFVGQLTWAVWEAGCCEMYVQAEVAVAIVLQLLADAANKPHDEPVLSTGELQELADEAKRRSR
jgi:hypothetical protein